MRRVGRLPAFHIKSVALDEGIGGYGHIVDESRVASENCRSAHKLISSNATA